MEYHETDNPELTEAMRLAKSPAGKQLLELLQKHNAQALQSALRNAAQGNYEAARETINAFLSTPDAKALLDQLRDKP